MRGQADIGQLTNEAVVAERLKHRCLNSPKVYRAELRIAGHGTYLGEWHDVKGHADDDLAELQAKHTPVSKGDGFSAAQHLSIKESLGQIAKRELGHNMNMAYEG